MAVCDLCTQEMTTAASCTVAVLHREGEAVAVRRYGGRRGPCGDCGVRAGGLHHPGCDQQWCPRCRHQLIMCDCGWDEMGGPDPFDESDEEEDVEGGLGANVLSLVRARMVTGPGDVRLVPFGGAAAPLRARCHGDLRSLAAWALAEGRPCDLDVAAVCLVALEGRRVEHGYLLHRPTVQTVQWADMHNEVTHLGTQLPDDWRVTLWSVLVWLHTEGRLDPQGDPLAVLLEPLRCDGGLGADGLPMAAGEDIDFPCQCDLAHDPTLPPGVAQHIVGRDRRSGRTLVVSGHVRPRSQRPGTVDQLPLLVLAARLPNFTAGDFAYVGRVDADRWAPELWLYDHATSRRRDLDVLALDGEGRPWTIWPDGRRKTGFRWQRDRDVPAVLRAGFDFGPAEAAARAEEPPDEDRATQPADETCAQD